MQYDFIRYLAAKKRIDDRSLNHAVYRSLTRHPLMCKKQQPLRIIELGAGIGTMVERLLERQLWQDCRYTAVESVADNLDQAARRLAQWATASQSVLRPVQAGFLQIASKQGTTTVDLQQADVYRYLRKQGGKAHWDLLIAHAFMDLVNMETVLDLCRNVLKPGGLLYLTLNFDGETILLPPIDTAFDRLVIDAYHRTMDERRIDDRSSGDSHTGRHLFGALDRIGASIVSAGSSDWVLHPVDGTYHPDEDYFLHYIIHTITTALENKPDLDGMRLLRWQNRRHRQIEEGRLVYIAKQLDLLARLEPAGRVDDR